MKTMNIIGVVSRLKGREVVISKTIEMRGGYLEDNFNYQIGDKVAHYYQSPNPCYLGWILVKRIVNNTVFELDYETEKEKVLKEKADFNARDFVAEWKQKNA